MVGIFSETPLLERFAANGSIKGQSDRVVPPRGAASVQDSCGLRKSSYNTIILV